MDNIALTSDQLIDIILAYWFMAPPKSLKDSRRHLMRLTQAHVDQVAREAARLNARRGD